MYTTRGTGECQARLQAAVVYELRWAHARACEVSQSNRLSCCALWDRWRRPALGCHLGFKPALSFEKPLHIHTESWPWGCLPLTSYLLCALPITLHGTGPTVFYSRSHQPSPPGMRMHIASLSQPHCWKLPLRAHQHCLTAPRGTGQRAATVGNATTSAGAPASHRRRLSQGKPLWRW